MRVKVFDVTGPGIKTFRCECTLLEFFAGDAEGARAAEGEIAKSGQCCLGGGAAPAVVLARAISPADSFDYIKE